MSNFFRSIHEIIEKNVPAFFGTFFKYLYRPNAGELDSYSWSSIQYFGILLLW
jgi:hypothetical protein